MKVKLWLCKEEEKYHMLFDVQKKPRRNLLGFDRPATSYSCRGKTPTTIGARELNFCVRNGNRCDLSAIVTGQI